MENQLLPISPCKTQERSVSADALIREWLFRFGVEHKEDVAPRLPLWLESFGAMDTAVLERLFSRALKTCRFFPKVSEVLGPLTTAEAKAAPEAAEEAWARVLEIRRVHWNPDIPGPFNRAIAKLSERLRQAARAAGVFRNFESVEALHTWAKKRFVESFIAYGEVEQDRFLLPDGEIKRLLAGAAEAKSLPSLSDDWSELRERGEAYRTRMKVATEKAPTKPGAPIHKTLHVTNAAEIERQKRLILQKHPNLGNMRGIPLELRPVEVSA